ncbi:hypothetical protein EV356DRAFT_98534 [Viridothelium virens]|uniref:Uncharacterized protein n=1 Tax=Viridothelium virens TaxID=1048519 RepID=A0A6A6HCL3_VIRVR|nr:hypothetical protein EV356DRAFT_98534 [Viridothelium virens]
MRSIADYTYVDETAEIASYYTLDPDRSASTPSGELNSDETFVRNRQDAPASASSSDETEPSSFNQCLSSSSKRQCNDALPYRPYLSPDDVISTCSISPTLSQHIQLSPPPRNYTSLPKSDASLSLQPHFDAQEACLMRYFIVELAHYVSCQELGVMALGAPRIETADTFYRLISVMAPDTLPQLSHLAQEHVLHYSTPSILHRQDT